MIKDFLMKNKEGIIVGAIWGIASPLISLGMSTLPKITIFHKLLILPTMLADYLPLEGKAVLVATVIVGAILGMLVDVVYKPND